MGKGISKLQAKAGYGYSSTLIKLYLSVRCPASGCLTSYYFREVWGGEGVGGRGFLNSRRKPGYGYSS